MMVQYYSSEKHDYGDRNGARKASLRVSIPTIPERMNFLTELIKSLNSQTYTDFDIALIVTKGSSDLYKGIESDIPVHIIEQQGHGFMDAMQLTVSSSMGYDINVNLDDDSVIGRDHVERYLKEFSGSGKVGMIFGTEDGLIPGIHGNFEKFLRFNYFINRQPLVSSLSKYYVYFNSAGILSGRTDYGTGTATLLGSGTNMAWTSEALAGARLPSYNEKSLGILNEQYLALQSVLRGFEVRTGRIDSIPRKETRGKSLSSDVSLKGYDRRLLELYSSPVFVDSITEVNIAVLKKAISKMRLLPLRGEVRMGIRVLSCALHSIESGLGEEEAFSEIERLWVPQVAEVRGEV